MKPSEIYVDSFSPFLGTFDKAEREYAAAYLVLGMRHKGDEFVPVVPRDCGEACKALDVAGELPEFCRVPPAICGVDFDGLVIHGWAEWTEPDRGRASPIAFTEKGLERLKAKWWRPDGA